MGWCIDTVWHGLSDRLHAHSCKPQGGDVQFRHDDATAQLISVAFDTKCATHQGANEPLILVDCDPGSSFQKLTYDPQKMTLHPEDAPSTCLAVGESSQSAGPYMSRDLLVRECAETDQTHKTWIVLP